ncbi:amidase family protein [Rhodococcus sp. NPDC059968]|uniref:amidase family protein n=1 Tax=Rhodococcus sp. NPDC059968 TaxID=3347017 RepID=UPI00366EB1A9
MEPIPIGKTNVPEFSYRTETDNLVSGKTLNPYNVDRTLGGSSGGEAAAIATGMSPIGLGSDVAISVRGPHCTAAGSRSVTSGEPTERMIRQAAFSMVCTTTPEIKSRILTARTP